MAQKKRRTKRRSIAKTHVPVDAFESKSVAKASAADYTHLMRHNPRNPNKACTAKVREHRDGRRLKFTVFVPKSCERYL